MKLKQQSASFGKFLLSSAVLKVLESQRHSERSVHHPFSNKIILIGHRSTMGKSRSDKKTLIARYESRLQKIQETLGRPIIWSWLKHCSVSNEHIRRALSTTPVVEIGESSIDQKSVADRLLKTSHRYTAANFAAATTYWSHASEVQSI